MQVAKMQIENSAVANSCSRMRLISMPKSSLPTLADVARLANVSTATISRVLNSPEKVAESTRLKVLRAIDALGYSPNFSAKALVSNRTNTIGAVIPTMDNAIFARGLQAFQETITPAGVTLLVANSYYNPAIEEQQIRTMIARGADGLLLIGNTRSNKVYEFLNHRRIPYVIAWNYNKGTSYPCVGFDNTAAAQQLTQLAVDFGHQNFALISAAQKSNDRARDRITGMKRALKHAGFTTDKIPIVEAPYSITDSGKAFKKIIQNYPDTTIVMCGNDVQAVGAIKMAQSMGIKVPSDISITGFDDLEITTIIQPAVTTVHVPHRKMGIKAAELLLTMMNGKTTTERIKLPTRIIERESLAAPGK